MSPLRNPWWLAIDIGTTDTTAAVPESGSIRELMMPDGSASVPSSAFAEDTELLVGRDADRLAVLAPERYLGSVKCCWWQESVILGDKEFRLRS